MSALSTLLCHEEETNQVHMYFFIHKPDAWEVTILFLEEEKDFRIDLKSKKNQLIVETFTKHKILSNLSWRSGRYISGPKSLRISSKIHMLESWVFGDFITVG